MPFHKSFVDWLTMRGKSYICRERSRRLDAAGLALQLLWSNGCRRFCGCALLAAITGVELKGAEAAGAVLYHPRSALGQCEEAERTGGDGQSRWLVALFKAKAAPGLA